uniref:Uncharacterized protein n=1 Tax=viral metagenome TaxID=1070528 RepID=A0A6H2A4E4_9ZZZZ
MDKEKAITALPTGIRMSNADLALFYGYVRGMSPPSLETKDYITFVQTPWFNVSYMRRYRQLWIYVGDHGFSLPDFHYWRVIGGG